MHRAANDQAGIRTFLVAGLSSSPLSSAVACGDLVFASGQVGRDPASGSVPTSFSEQASQAIANLSAVLGGAGASLDTVVKTTVYLVRRSDFDGMNRIYSEAFESPPPARTTLVVGLAGEDLLFEIDAIAVRESRT